ncbi:glycosyltransferase [Flavobacterium sp. FlaQc-57]|uniref:glycosyltransferase n=1 Tax=Flavobacterium sp. FlaQc-57 TaxID=3374186 RepID=UPI003757D69E
MENNTLISIIIPCFNDVKFIEQSVFSALNQTHFQVEVIVVDDGSNLETKKVLKSLESKITKLITQENSGQSKARNIGIEVANGNYILVLDSDDYLESTFCEKAFAIFKNNLDLKLVSCYANLIFENNKTILFKPVGGTIHDFLFSNAALGTSMFKKEDWDNCGGYDETMKKGFEDWEFFIRLLKTGGSAEIIQEPLYNYRKRNDSTTTRANLNKYELLNYIYAKHKDLYIDNYGLFIDHLLTQIQRQEQEKLKCLKKNEYQIGYFLLRPLRFIKSFLNK